LTRSRGVLDTYRLLRRVSSINGPGVKKDLLDRVIFNTEPLPPLGKEYWWFLFFSDSGEKPVQVMFLIYRKHGERMLFNGEEMALSRMGDGELRAVTSGWVFDGERIRDLGDSNVYVRFGGDEIATEVSGETMTLCGGYPDYRFRVSGKIDLVLSRGDFLEDRDARGVFLPPFGVGWVDIYSHAEGTVLGSPFEGTSHLQKVFGVTIYGPFHWGRIVFRNGSVASLFTLKTGRISKTFIHGSFTFFDKENGEIIRLRNPRLTITVDEGSWIINGRDGDRVVKMVLGIYARKEFIMKGGGTQVYIEYAVKAREFTLRTRKRSITLEDLGDGVGTFEDAY
jgi:hypothetical protein